MRGRCWSDCNPWKIKVLHLQDWDYRSSLINRHWAPWKVKTIRRRELEYQLQGWDFFSSICKNSQGMKTAPKGWQVWLKLSRKTLAKAGKPDYSKQHHPLSIAVDMDCNGWNFQLMWQSYVLHFLDNIQWLGFSTDVVILNFWLFKTYISWNFQRMWQSYVFDLLEMQWLELPTEVAILYIWLLRQDFKR